MRSDRDHGVAPLGVLALTAAALWAAGCSSRSPTGPTPPAVPGTVAGAVIDAGSSQPLAEAIVASGSTRDTTRTDGVFALSLPPGNAAITVGKAGFTLNQLIAGVASGTTRQVTVALLPVGATQSIAVPTGGRVWDPRTYAQISLPPNFVTAAGPVEVSVTGVDPTAADVRAVPGGLDAVNAAGQPVDLQPVSFAEFTVRDAAGNLLPYNPAATTGARIELPIPLSLRGQPGYGIGDSIDCYRYDPADGRWKHPVRGVIGPSTEGGVPAIQVTVFHLSWYGGARASSGRACVRGVVRLEGGSPAVGVGIEAFPGGTATTDAAGQYQVDASPNSSIRVVATRVAGAGVQTGEVQVTTLAPGGTCSTAQDIVLAGPTGSYLVYAALADGPPTDTLCAGVYVHIALDVGGVPTPYNDARVEIDGGIGFRTVPIVGGEGYGGQYLLCAPTAGFAVTAGGTYDLRIDYDRDGTWDATGQVRMCGVPVMSNPTDQATVGPTFFATWTDPADFPGYAPSYLLELSRPGFERRFLTTSPSRVIGDGTVDMSLGYPQANDPLAAGGYDIGVTAFTGSWFLLLPYGLATPNMTGTNTRGYFAALGTSQVVSFTSGAPGSPSLARRERPAVP